MDLLDARNNDPNLIKELKEKTIDLYKAAQQKLPKNTEVNIDLARLLSISEPEAAVDCYQKCIDLDCDSDSNDLDQNDKSFISSEIVNILLKLKKSLRIKRALRAT